MLCARVFVRQLVLSKPAIENFSALRAVYKSLRPCLRAARITEPDSFSLHSERSMVSVASQKTYQHRWED